MTVTAELTPNSVRTRHPDWWIWQLGQGWWAMHKYRLVLAPGSKPTLQTLSRDTPEALDEALTEADA
ncbi:hypothetical protein ACIBCT_21440 [Streptosporangium sp. NPDC050855]|uniref:hypothetical protein n=1 Tax=Streptosporangium sp. NPDC050855 TaxID=3366194 RepID=UPI0037A46DEC